MSNQPMYQQNNNLSEDQRLSMEDENRPLPKGWVRDFDPNTNHHFYVDTTTNPPRSIWVHPFEDPEYRKMHPDQFNKPASSTPAGSSAAGPSGAGTHGGAPRERGFLSKLKDKAFGTKEEREEAKRQREAREREAIQRYVLRRQQMMQARPIYGQGPYGGFPQQGYGGYPQQGYGAYPPPAMAYGGRQRRGGGMGLPLVGGLAGGMLLGSMLDNDYAEGYQEGFEDAGDFGGGDFGGDF